MWLRSNAGVGHTATVVGVGGKKGARMVQDPMQGGRGLVKPHQMID